MIIASKIFKVLRRRCLKVCVIFILVVLTSLLLYSALDTVAIKLTGSFGIKNYFHKQPKTPFTVRVDGRSKVSFSNCAALISYNESTVNETKRLLKTMSMHSIGPLDYLNMTQTCENFTQTRHYIMDTLSKEEEEFPIAYSILMYRDVEQFERLLRAIYRPQNVYCVHVDLKSNSILFKAVESIVRCFPNVFMSPKRISVKWGQFSVLEPELICMDLLLKKNKLWKYFINLTGQEFPLKTNYELVKILSAYNGSNNIFGSRAWRWQYRWKDAGSPPYNITVTKGSVHIVATRGYVEYISTNQKAKDIIEWGKHTIIPDEMVFATLNNNRHLEVPGSYVAGASIAELRKHGSRYKKWGGKCDGYFKRKICIFGIGDLHRLAGSEKLFANKFEWNNFPSRLTFECIEELLDNRTLERTNVNTITRHGQFFTT